MTPTEPIFGGVIVASAICILFVLRSALRVVRVQRDDIVELEDRDNELAVALERYPDQPTAALALIRKLGAQAARDVVVVCEQSAAQVRVVARYGLGRGEVHVDASLFGRTREVPLTELASTKFASRLSAKARKRITRLQAVCSRKCPNWLLLTTTRSDVTYTAESLHGALEAISRLPRREDAIERSDGDPQPRTLRTQLKQLVEHFRKSTGSSAFFGLRTESGVREIVSAHTDAGEPLSDSFRRVIELTQASERVTAFSRPLLAELGVDSRVGSAVVVVVSLWGRPVGSCCCLSRSLVVPSAFIEQAEELAQEIASIINLAEQLPNFGAGRDARRFATLVHDLRTPTNGIRSVAQLMRGTRMSPDQSTYLRMLESSTESLSLLLENVLEGSADDSNLRLNEAPASLREMVNTVWETVVYQGFSKSLELHSSVDPEVPDRVSMDSMRVQRVLMNLLANAVKFTSHGNVELRCCLVSLIGGLAQIEFSVTDTGAGIHEDDVEAIFEPFVRTSNSGAVGTGLGLPVARRLARLMGGDIRANSALGVGSTFTFQAQFHVEGDHHVAQETFPGLSAIIVDDSTASAGRLCEQLRSFGVRARIDDGVYDDPDVIVFRDSKTLRTPTYSRHRHVVTLRSPGHPEEREIASDGIELTKPIGESDLRRVLSEIAGRSRQAPLSHHRECVLLVDDDAVSRETVRRRLSLMGYRVYAAACARDAIEIFMRERPAVVITDMMMPGTTGHDLVLRLRDLNPRASFVVASGLPESSLPDKLSFVDDYVEKPLSEGKLKAILRRVNGRADCDASERRHGDLKLDKRLMNTFKTSWNLAIPVILEGLTDEDVAKVSGECHRLRGAAACLGADSLETAIADIEGLVDDGEFETAVSAYHVMQERFDEWLVRVPHESALSSTFEASQA